MRVQGEIKAGSPYAVLEFASAGSASGKRRSLDANANAHSIKTPVVLCGQGAAEARAQTIPDFHARVGNETNVMPYMPEAAEHQTAIRPGWPGRKVGGHSIGIGSDG